MKFRGSKERLKDSIKLIPAVLAGKHPDLLGLKPVFWGEVGNAVLKLIQEDMVAKGAGARTSTGKWKQLAPETLERRKRKGFSGEEILQETHRLLASFTPGTGHLPSGVADQVFNFLAAGIEIGTDVEYAEFHQDGVPGRIPQRPIVPKTGKIPHAWDGAVADAIERGIQKVMEMIVAAGGID